jgi:hypothetical protein
METKENKMAKVRYRLSVPLSKEIYEQITAEAQRIGVSAPTHAAHLIGYHLATSKSLLAGLNETLRKGLEDVSKNRTEDE